MSIPRSRVASAAGAVGTAVLVLTGCGPTDVSDPTARAAAGGVTVTVELHRTSANAAELRATFRPDQPGFHVYSIDLPDEGVDGLGIPTRIGVRGAGTADGPPTADQPTRLIRPAGLPTEIPVYPDGAVTFRLPVHLNGSGPMDVVVSYGACSESRCLMPVTNKAIRLDLEDLEDLD